MTTEHEMGECCLDGTCACSDAGNKDAIRSEDEKLYTQADLDFFSANADEYFAMANTARDEADRAWVVLDWLAENNPAALELCPYKARR